MGLWKTDGGRASARIDRTTLTVRPNDPARSGRRRVWVWEVWDDAGACIAHGAERSMEDAMQAAERAFVCDRTWLDAMATDDLHAYLAACEDAHAEDPDAGWDARAADARRALDRRSSAIAPTMGQLALDLDD